MRLVGGMGRRAATPHSSDEGGGTEGAGKEAKINLGRPLIVN